jgi:hypothetical protein
MKNTLRIRQGDVLFTRVKKIPKGARQYREKKILAYGEVTGHSHAVATADSGFAEVMDIEGYGTVLVSDRGISIVHEEHGAVEIPAGIYRVDIQREYTPEAIRNVAD